MHLKRHLRSQAANKCRKEGSTALPLAKATLESISPQSTAVIKNQITQPTLTRLWKSPCTGPGVCAGPTVTESCIES